MPYSGADDDKLPDNVKKLPASKRRQWVAVWNSSYSACQEKGGDGCESVAFRNANGVIKKSKNEMTTNFLFTDLTLGLGNNKPFDALAPGKFTDMYGRPVEIKSGDLQTYVDNTRLAIEATRTEGGELVGLPIDAHDHDKGDGAGWIVDVLLESNRVRVVPRWTEIGLDLISKGIRRFFSATVDTSKKILYGGTLTNWPASRDHKTGLILLRPVELSADVIADTQDVYTWANSSWFDEIKAWIAETFLDAPHANPTPPPGGGTTSQEDNLMTLELTPEELDAKIAAVVNTAVGSSVEAAIAKALSVSPPPTPPAPNGNGDDANNDLASMLGLTNLEAGAQARIEAALAAQMETIKKSAETRYMQQLAMVTRKHDVTELAQRLTGGTPENPRGIPAKAEDLAKHLLALSKEEAAFWQDLCLGIVANGLVEFAELGHGKDVKGTKQLPPEVETQLLAGELKLIDLTNPILALGDPSEYDLSKFKS